MLYSIENCIFTLDELNVFRLTIFGDIPESLSHLSNEEIVEAFIGDLEFNTPDEADEPSVYKGTLMMDFQRDYFGESNEDVHIENLVKINL